jgi:hypothetical protein
MVGSKEVGPDSALLVVLLAVVAVGVLDGLSQGAIFGDAADLPPAYTHVSCCCRSCTRQATHSLCACAVSCTTKPPSARSFTVTIEAFLL